MKLNSANTIALLLKGAYITEDDVKRAKGSSAGRTDPIEYLISQGIITKHIVGQAIAESFGIPYAELDNYPPPKEQILEIPESMATAYRVVLYKRDDKIAILATDNPKQAEVFLHDLTRRFPKIKSSLAFAFTEDIERLFINYRKALDTRFSQILAKEAHVAPEIIEEILADALAYRASDLHFEPQEKDVVIRFRIDGILHEAGRLPKEHYESVLNRIKVKSHMRIDEHMAAQDGVMRYGHNGDTIEMRISIVPTLDGETVAIRMLSEYVRSFTMADLGLSEANQHQLIEASQKPFGMILVTGPTGSGKTTTLYALVKILNRPEVNITTIEDPVEYKVAGVNQIQVNTQTNLTFAEGLRSVVRQDPNIILVGEIRDRETAEIAVNAALTGHLLLSSFHANDAATAMPRLLDMGVEPFLLSSTLELVIAQRLVRKVCESCRLSYTVKFGELKARYPEVAPLFKGENQATLYRGKGCSVCNGTGYRGRTAIFEFIHVTQEMQELLLGHPSTHQIWDLARKNGAKTLFEDGIEKAKNGVTTIEEVLRVAKPNT